MSYQVLARKYRPANFEELVGQEHVLKALSSALDHQRMHHAYLFTGTRGVGKTTIARILARCLNCDEGVSSKPCGVCSACNEISEGRFVDLIEVDAASRTKVEDTRELLENVQYSPTRGRYKVYLIDEVHMLSNHSFNALLKTLEEPPPHVVFLLATTDPQKLPPTVLSRCLQFNLKNMTADRIVSHLKHVLSEEEIPAEQSALWQLARAANGSMRDALSLTDQAIAYSEQNLTEVAVAGMLGSMDQTRVYSLFEAVYQGDAVRALQVIAEIDEQAPDYARALAQFLSLLHQIALCHAMPDYKPSLSELELDKLKQLAQMVPAEEVQLFYQLGLKSQSDLVWAPDPKSGFEMAILRMIAFRPSDSDLPPTGRTKADSSKKKPETLTAPVSEASAASEASASATKLSATKLSASAEQITTVSELPGLTTRTVEEFQALFNDSRFENEAWLELNDYLVFDGLLSNFASHCVLQNQAGNHWFFVLDKGHAAIQGNGLENQLQQKLETFFDSKLILEFTVAELEQDSPSRRRQLIRAQRRKQAYDELQQRDIVSWFVENFDAQVDESSVAYLDELSTSAQELNKAGSDQ